MYTVSSILKELSFHCSMNIRAPKVYPIQETIAELIAKANELTDLDEGFVVFDHVSGKRMKIKNSAYLIAHRIRGNDTVPTRKNLMTLVLEGDASEFLCYFPEWEKQVEELQAEVCNFLHYAEAVYNAHKDLESQKDFALAIKNEVGSGYMFSARKLGKTVTQVFQEADLNVKLNTFGI